MRKGSTNIVLLIATQTSIFHEKNNNKKRYTYYVFGIYREVPRRPR